MSTHLCHGRRQPRTHDEGDHVLDPTGMVGTIRKETDMATAPMVRADVYGLLPSILVLLLLILASLGIVAQAATP
jgi:hypothetical protein